MRRGAFSLHRGIMGRLVVAEYRLLENNRNNHSLLMPTTTINPRREGQWLTRSFQIDWTTVAMVIGLLASLIAVLFFARRDRD
jgi:hypothetical protein